MAYIEFIKDLLDKLNVDGTEALMVLLLLLIISYFFKHYFGIGEKIEESEKDDIRYRLSAYSKSMRSIKEYKYARITREDLYYEFLDLLEMCSNNLKKIILDLDFKDEVAFEAVISKVIDDYNHLKLNDRSSFFQKSDEGTLVYLAYFLRINGVGRILTSAFMSMVSLMVVLIGISLFVKMSTYSYVDKLFYGANIVFMSLYIILLITFLDIIVAKRFRWSVLNILILSISMLSIILVIIVGPTSPLSIIFWVTIILTILTIPKLIQKKQLIKS